MIRWKRRRWLVPTILISLVALLAAGFAYERMATARDRDRFPLVGAVADTVVEMVQLLGREMSVGEGYESACDYDEAELLALDFGAFDQDTSPGGWRAVAAVEGCEHVAASLISRYREAHMDALTADQMHLLWWHEGQVLASAGDDAAAIERLLAARALESQSPPPGMPEEAVAQWRAFMAADRAYRDATIAFLRRDHAAVEEAYARLLAVPEPSDFAEFQDAMEAQRGVRMEWPPNREPVAIMVACPDARFGVDCRQTGEK